MESGPQEASLGKNQELETKGSQGGIKSSRIGYLKEGVKTLESKIKMGL